MSGVPVIWWRVHFYATHEWMNGSASYSLPVPYQSVCALPTQLQSPNQTSMTERLAQGSCRIGIRELWFGWSPPSPVEQAYSPTAIIWTQQCSLCGLACVAFGWRLVRGTTASETRANTQPARPLFTAQPIFFTRCKCHSYHFPPPPPASCQDTSPFLAPRLEQLGSSCVISITSHCTSARRDHQLPSLRNNGSTRFHFPTEAYLPSCCCPVDVNAEAEASDYRPVPFMHSSFHMGPPSACFEEVYRPSSLLCNNKRR